MCSERSRDRQVNEYTAEALSCALDLQLMAPVAFFGLVKFTAQRTSSRTLYNLLLSSPVSCLRLPCQNGVELLY